MPTDHDKQPAKPAAPPSPLPEAHANRKEGSPQLAGPPSAKRGFGVAALVAVAVAAAGLSSVASVVVVRKLAAGSLAAAGQADAPIYQCPMHPSVVQDHPGDCPICGMKLVKVEKAKPSSERAANAAPSDLGSDRPAVPGLAAVEVDPARQQLIGLKTTAVELGSVGGAIRTVGRVAIDETRVRHVNLKVTAFVERIYVDYVGKKVHKGDPLFSIYSPELLATQEEYLLALKTRDDLAKLAGPAKDEDNGLVAAARRRLELWDIPSAAMDQIERTRTPTKTLTLYSPASGVVTKKDVVEGMKLDAGAMPYEIVDLSTVWVLADVYERELRLVKEGMAATLTFAAFPNREFKGKVAFLDPLLDPQTRTVKVRVSVANPTGELRPEMFGEVVLLGARHEANTIPTDAVIDSGTEKVVFVAVGEGKFEPRLVKIGQSDGSRLEVVSGLTLGERVVIRANFLVDSESRLRASLAAVGGGASSAKPVESARVLPPSVPAAAPAQQPSEHGG